MPVPQQPPVHLGESFLTDPHASYAALRRRAAVHPAVTPDGAPVWLVTGYREVREAAADPRLLLGKRHARTTGRHGESMPPELDAHLLNTDPPDHTRLRRLVSGTFTPRRVERLRRSVQAATDRLLDRMAGQDRADVMADLATPLSLTVICDLLGVPEEDRHDLRGWTDTLLSPAPDAAVRSREAMRSLHRHLTGLVGRKRADPGDDLLSALVAAASAEPGDTGARLTERELVAMAFLLLFGGYHNSASLTGTTVLALLSSPDLLSAVRSGTLGMDAVTEEALRWNSPAMLAVRRFAGEDLRIGGTDIRAGDRVWLSWASANRDPDRFTVPGTFDPSRRDGTGHLAFGHGAHFCPGAALARMENEIAVTSLLRRFPALSPAVPLAELRWTASLRSRGLRQLPVSLKGL